MQVASLAMLNETFSLILKHHVLRCRGSSLIMFSTIDSSRIWMCPTNPVFYSWKDWPPKMLTWLYENAAITDSTPDPTMLCYCPKSIAYSNNILSYHQSCNTTPRLTSVMTKTKNGGHVTNLSLQKRIISLNESFENKHNFFFDAICINSITE